MDRIPQLNRVRDVEELPAISWLRAIVGVQVERIVGAADDPECLLIRIISLQHVTADVTSPRYLERIVICIKVVGCEVQIAVSITRYRVVERAIKLRIRSSRISRTQHRSDGNHIDVAAESGAIS